MTWWTALLVGVGIIVGVRLYILLVLELFYKFWRDWHNLPIELYNYQIPRRATLKERLIGAIYCLTIILAHLVPIVYIIGNQVDCFEQAFTSDYECDKSDGK